MTWLRLSVCSHGEDNDIGGLLPIGSNFSNALTPDSKHDPSKNFERIVPFSIENVGNNTLVPPGVVKNLVDIDVIQEWLKYCRNNYGERCERHETTDAKFRLIDVEHRQLIRASLDTKYVILS